ncbi:MAG: CapA family protein [Kofleriaceae bacterium]
MACQFTILSAARQLPSGHAMGSPYPLSYDLQWPFLHLVPSTREHIVLPRRPLAHDFVPHRDSEIARIACFGDLMGLTGDRMPAFAGELAAVFARADLVIGNCEAPVVRGDKDPRAFYLQRFRMATAYLREALDRLAIDPARAVLSIANNHTGDRGEAGARVTADLVHELGAGIAGLRAQPLTVRDVRGLRVGVAAWTAWMNARGDHGVMRTADALAHDWRGYEVDTLIASPHWDWEFQHFPSAETVEHARILAAAGFDAIAGHHPHVVQPIGWFGDTVCQFSLGNLMARTLTWPHRLVTVLELHVSLATGTIAGYRCHPFVQLDDAIVPLASAPPRYRAKMERRLAILFA